MEIPGRPAGGDWKLEIGNEKFPKMGLYRFDSAFIQNLQADAEGNIVKNPSTTITANIVSKAKAAFASAFTPSFALARA